MGQENRIVGHAMLSAEIGVGRDPNNYVIDWCIYEVDEKKLGYFAGNVVDLGNQIPAGKYMELMNPNIQNPYKFIWPRIDSSGSEEKYQLNEMKRPIMLNKDGTPCFLVLKRGRTTDMTYGIGNEIFSVTRTHIPNGPTFKAKE